MDVLKTSRGGRGAAISVKGQWLFSATVDATDDAQRRAWTLSQTLTRLAH